MAKIGDIPEGLPLSVDAKMSWLRRFSRDIVDKIFNPTNPDDVKMVIEAMKEPGGRNGAEDVPPYPYCTCREGKYLKIFC